MSDRVDGERLKAAEGLLGYTFSDPALLERALTCPSFRAERQSAGEGDNQRLEFLGDAVIGLLAAECVFARHALEDEGRLTVRRSKLASGIALAERARSLGLGAYLRVGRTEEAGGSRDHNRTLTDALEAVFGAIWLDGGLEAAREAFNRLLWRGADPERDDRDDNPKGALQEVSQRHAWPDSPRYELVESTGVAHAPTYTVRASVACGLEALGKGRTKRAAEVSAARDLLKLIEASGLAG